MEIFVVDDERDVQLLFDKCIVPQIARPDWHFHYAFGGQEALGYLLNNRAIELMILDLLMPNMSGLEVLAQVMPVIPWLTVIIMSGKDDYDDLRQAMNAGAYDYLVKPVQYPILRDALLRAETHIQTRQQLLRKAHETQKALGQMLRLIEYTDSRIKQIKRGTEELPEEVA